MIKDPSIILNKKKQNIALQFDMHHGHGLLNKAIIQLHKKDRKDFKKFVTEKTSFNPHIMFISKKKFLVHGLEMSFSGYSNVKKSLD